MALEALRGPDPFAGAEHATLTRGSTRERVTVDVVVPMATEAFAAGEVRTPAELARWGPSPPC